MAENALRSEEFEALVQKGGVVDMNRQFNMTAMTWASAEIAEETC